MKLSFSIPFKVNVNDYHSFESVKEFLKELTGQKIKVKEFNLTEKDSEDYAGYMGVVYIGKAPSKKEILKLKTIYFE